MGVLVAVLAPAVTAVRPVVLVGVLVPVALAVAVLVLEHVLAVLVAVRAVVPDVLVPAPRAVAMVALASKERFHGILN